MSVDDRQPVGELTFEQALERLEAIIRELEEGQIGLAEGLSHYEQGVQLLRHCYQGLENAQRRIELLSRIDADGNPVTEPFDDQAIPLDEKAQSRGRRRSRPPTTDAPSASDDMDGTARLF
jgi:exodeoxyribonuclease VII small subunit